MAKTPVKQSSRLGPKLIGVGVLIFFVTRLVILLPLGLVGTWINGLLYPIMLLALIAGGGLMYLKAKRS